MDKVFKALSDPSRRHLLDRLHEREGQTLGELCAGLQMARQSATQHLAVLEAADLISSFGRGREKLHYLNPVPIHELQDRWIDKFERPRLQALSELKRQAEEDEMTGLDLGTPAHRRLGHRRRRRMARGPLEPEVVAGDRRPSPSGVGADKHPGAVGDPGEDDHGAGVAAQAQAAGQIGDVDGRAALADLDGADAALAQQLAQTLEVPGEGGVDGQEPAERGA